MPNIVLSYCPWDTEKGARGYIALHHLYIMAQEGILRKYPLPHDTLQFISCPDITPFYEHSVKLQTIHSHTWASSSISTNCSKDKRKVFATIMKSFSYKYFLPCPGNTSPQYVQRNGIVGHLPSSSIRYFVESSQSLSAGVKFCNFYAEVFLLPFNLNVIFQYVQTSE